MNGFGLLRTVVLSIGLYGCGTSVEQSARLQPGTLRVGDALGGVTDGFERASDTRDFQFPEDHGPHPAFRSEWWYLTCPLSDQVGPADQEFGVQFTLFRQALAPPDGGQPVSPWRSRQIYMAHAAVTDVAARVHTEESRFSRGHPRLAGVTTQPLSIYLEDWRLEQREALVDFVLPPLSLKMQLAKSRVELHLEGARQVVLQGDGGLSPKGPAGENAPAEASYYYSVPRLKARGRVITSTGEHEVTGFCWLDREWSTSVLGENRIGWDWFALHLKDGRSLMLFQVRSRAEAGLPPFRQAKWMLPDPSLDIQEDPSLDIQETRTVSNNTLSVPPNRLTLHVLRDWVDETGQAWPVEWRLGVAGESLRVVAALDDQRMRSAISYWEGLVWVHAEDGRRIGAGYLEMTGYDAMAR